jgi:Uma2 family endonuclease
MSTVRQREPISIADYLAGELMSPVKHEFVDGRVYAMVGARNVHNMIAMNAALALGYRLKGKKCRPFNSDTKIRIRLASHTRFYYPDVSVVCRLNPPDDTFQDEPALIVEVLSRSTRRLDIGEKKDAYLTIDSLQVYLLVEQDFARVTAFRRTANGFITEIHDGLTAIVALAEIDAELPLAELYEAVEFAPEPEPEVE